MSKKTNIPTITLLLSLLPFFGYLIAYGYEASYLAVYEIPSIAAQITINAVIISAIYFIVITSIVLAGLDIYHKWSLRFKKRIFIRLLLEYLTASFIVCSIFFLILPDRPTVVFFIALLVSIVVVFLDFGKPLILFRSFDSFKKKLILYHQFRLNTKEKESQPFIGVNDSYFQIFCFLVFTAVIGFMVADDLGGAIAVNQKYYATFRKGDYDYALIRVYGSEKIAVRYYNNEIVLGDVYMFSSNELSLNQTKLKVPKSKMKSFLNLY